MSSETQQTSQTAEILREAVVLEEDTARKYAEFAEIARKDGNESAAELFEELGRVKELHADILKSSGEEAGTGCGDCTGSCSTGGGCS